MFTGSLFIISCVFVCFLTCAGGVSVSPTTDRCQLPIKIVSCQSTTQMVWYAYNVTINDCVKFTRRCPGNDNNFMTEGECEVACEGKDLCEFPIYSGPCDDTNSFPFYVFNTTSGQCEKITNACHNNPNKFYSEEDCEITCEDVCNRPIVPGPCKGSFKRYAYNKTSRQCEEFVYGGCGGNGNNFETEDLCEEECEDVCKKKIVSGMCLAYGPSFGYNQESGQCEFFVYGGCGGTDNRFPTEEKCEETCEDDPCKMLIDPGSCKALFPVYGYNKFSGQCEKFDYGGCEGNANRFETEEECKNQCEDVCNKTIESGNCLAYIERYAYNKSSGMCEMFIYGGCGGNGNNFKIEKDCEDMCEAGCDKPIESGGCLDFSTRWAFNITSGQCQNFTYRGCEGNGNNYETENECEEECEA